MSPPSRHSCGDLINTSSLCLEQRNIFSLWARDIAAQIQNLPNSSSFSELLESIPVFEDAHCLSLSLLALVLLQYPGPIPSFDVIRCYTKHWLALPEAAKAGHDEESKPILQNTFEQICLSIGTIPSLFSSSSDTPALVDPTTQKFLTHQQLSVFVRDFSLPVPIIEASSKPVVVLALPNGFLLGLASLAVSSYYTAAPLNIAGGPSQFRSDVGLARPQCILVLESDVEKLGLREPWISEAEMQILLVLPQEDMTFKVRPLEDSLAKSSFPPARPNTATDLVLILFTSGTSGTKKVVPITGLGLLTGVQCVVDSWGLNSEDSCLNMMPLNHVGGLVRNLFAPVFSGGSTILCPAFDPNQFWDILEGGSGTWYYASPSMHMSILAEASLRGDSVSRCQLRLVCNAAGGLLPALAARLQDTFKCTVLPSYGMTECMPISTPPLNYTLNRVGTSGVGCGPEISILDDSDNHLPPGQVGRISVRGGPTFPGYLKDGQLDKSAFNKDGWFDTGDLGSLDQDGYLYLTGRGKEVINRGGEIISPFEVEEAITISFQDPKSILFGRVKQVLAFSAPHEVLQEVVGVALVTSPTQPRPDVRELQTALKSSLHSSKWPVVVVYMDALPTSNNKLVRIKLSERMDMMPITNDTTLPERHFEAVCPPINSPLSARISNVPCRLNLSAVLRAIEKYLDSKLEAHVAVSHHDGTPLVYLAPKECSQNETSHEDIIQQLQDVLRRVLDGYLMPSSITLLETPLPRDQDGRVDDEALHTILKELKNSTSSSPASETEQKIRKAFAEVLGFDVDEISSNSDFFDIGGESLSAGYLLSLLRRDIGVRIPVDKLFTSSKVFELCELVDQIITASSKNPNSPTQPIPECTETYSSTHPLVLIIHALPIVVLYPLKMAFQWTALMYALSTIAQIWDESNIAARFLALVAALFISRASTQIIAPICGIIFKWVVIGTYEEGIYPMWGLYHTRWWIVEKVLRICGKVSLHLIIQEESRKLTPSRVYSGI
jgi:acyl-CoA synthetase (AMP-forming)/AMP-acid ligase II/acyl carrier protein